ncbi:hypothetical protein ASE01_00450 [Nocardioides sp. Root190]|uniref:hypothetical protein n=1 Tax=Nocardioides sp. Root190 TaxID=1736488 RepID=UPI0006F908A1|nr:hypothetical protein [Nocardioides sp. Root190]KRB80017.1 hypothetical protein ASE01_00450 [Nocardioides sp. Root190]
MITRLWLRGVALVLAMLGPLTRPPARSRHRGLTATIWSGGLLALVLTLGACSEDIGEKVAEKIAEEQIGDGAEVDVDTGSGEVRIDDGSGSSYISGTQLPEDFPAEVPLIEGEILTGAAVKENDSAVWTVTVQVAGDAQEAFDEAVRLLEGAGFELATELQAGLYGGQLDNGTWDVVLAAYSDPDAGNTAVIYTVGDTNR